MIRAINLTDNNDVEMTIIELDDISLRAKKD